MQKLICDFCGEDAEPRTETLLPGDIVLFVGKQKIDMCIECKTALRNWVDKRTKYYNNIDEDSINKQEKYTGAKKKIGHWIYNPDTGRSYCSNCGVSCQIDKCGRRELDQCLNCGSIMIKEDSKNT